MEVSTIAGSSIEIPSSEVIQLARERSAQIYLIPEGYTPIFLRSDDAAALNIQNAVLWEPENYNGQSRDFDIHSGRFSSPSISHSGSTDENDFYAKSGDSTTNSKKSKALIAKVPRPRNAFIIYRGEKHHEVMKRGDITNTSASRVIAQMWKEELPHIKAYYQNLALEESLQHKLQHPEYRYSPRKPGEKQKRARRRPLDVSNYLKDNKGDTSDSSDSRSFNDAFSYMSSEESATCSPSVLSDASPREPARQIPSSVSIMQTTAVPLSQPRTFSSELYNCPGFPYYFEVDGTQSHSNGTSLDNSNERTKSNTSCGSDNSNSNNNISSASESSF
ncbi:hypothetical protein V1511DRAFT_454779 [Dipodascopsis uninucleata]